MALLKFKGNDGAWKTLFRDMMFAIKNRLRCDKNLHDVIDVAEARKALGILGDNNHTHYHDDRYMGKINAAEHNINELTATLQELRNKIQKEVADMLSRINDKLEQKIQEFNNNSTQMRREIDDFKRYVFKRGMIIDWYGAVNNIPVGWHLCDGTNGTPDLRDKFVLGAGGNFPLNGVGGKKSIKLTVDMIPEHRHTIFAAGSTDSDAHGGIDFAVQTHPDGITGTIITNGVYNEKSPVGRHAGGGGRQNTNTGERENSPYKRGTRGTGCNDTGGVQIPPDSVEQQVAVDIMPPYCALFKIMKM